MRSRFRWQPLSWSLAHRAPECRKNLATQPLIKVGREIRQMVIATLKPEERLAGLIPEELARLLEQIQAYLQQPQN